MWSYITGDLKIKVIEHRKLVNYPLGPNQAVL